MLSAPHQHGGGGALYNIGGHLIIRRCLFVNSTCSDPPGAAPGSTGGHNGGAVLSMRGKVETDDCEFSSGVAGQAGALYLFLYASLTARATRFIGNRAVCVNSSSTESGAAPEQHGGAALGMPEHNGCTWASGTGVCDPCYLLVCSRFCRSCVPECICGRQLQLLGLAAANATRYAWNGLCANLSINLSQAALSLWTAAVRYSST